MRYLLDTHTLLWFLNGDKQLSSSARKAIEDLDSIRFASIATIWEISIKSSLNKLILQTSFSEFRRELTDNYIELLPITFEDALTQHTLPLHHKDPFDRIIISQAINNNLTVITRDENFSLYGIKTLW